MLIVDNLKNFDLSKPTIIFNFCFGSWPFNSRVPLQLRERVPFAVVGSNAVVEAGGRRVRGRAYPWGVVEVENLEHNDFIALRNMLIR